MTRDYAAHVLPLALASTVFFRLMDSNGEAQSPTQPSALTGTTWKADKGDSHIRFEADGSWREDWGKTHYRGRWMALSNSEASVERSDHKTLFFTMSEDGKGLTRQDPSEHYAKEKLGDSSPLATDTSLNRGAFNKTVDVYHRYWKDIYGHWHYR